LTVTGTIGVTRLADGAGVHAVAPGDPLVMLEGAPDGARAAWSAPGGFAFVGPAYEGPGWWLTASGTGAAVTALVDAAVTECGSEVRGLTVPRGVPIGRWTVSDDVNEWDLMLTDAAPPPQPQEARIAQLVNLAQIEEFLDRVSPTHSKHADDPDVRAWAGIIEDGDLLAAGALALRPSGAAYLASIATAPQARGGGYGAAVTAHLTRTAFADGAAQCILGHYHPNESARRIYARLGYRTTHQCTSVDLKH
jgi:ribosomal protein S18 acetylase RimI-like enzyme